MSRHMYLDESKRDGYLMVGVIIDAADVRDARRALTSLLLPGQQRIHFKSESDGRRRTILQTISGLPIQAAVAVAPKALRDHAARAYCLEALVRCAAELAVSHVVVERDAPYERQDRDIIRARLQRDSHAALSTVRLAAPNEDPLLWAADGFAWAVAKGGHWRQRAGRTFQV